MSPLGFGVLVVAGLFGLGEDKKGAKAVRRLFVAAELSVSVVEKLVRLQNDLVEQIEDRFEGVRLRTVDAENIHITLKFLGDTEPALVPIISEVLEQLCEPLFPFELICHGLDAFPDRKRPRILWSRLDEQGAEVVGLLQQHVERDLAELGIEEDSREFVPHVTVARVRAQKPPSFDDLWKRYEDVQFGKSHIRDLVLYESHLDSTGPHYEVVQRFALGS